MIVSKFVKCITKLFNFEPYVFLTNLKRAPNPKRITVEENIISKEQQEKLCEEKENLRQYKLPLSKSDVCFVSKGILNQPLTCFSVPCCNLQLQGKNEKTSEKLSRRSQSTHASLVAEHQSAKLTTTPSKDDYKKILDVIPEQIEEEINNNNERNVQLLNKTKTNASEVTISKTKACPYCTLCSSIPKNYACPFCAKNLKNCTCIHCPHCKKSKISSSYRRSEPNKPKFFKFDKPPNYGPTGINVTLKDKIKAAAEKHNSWLANKMESRTFSKSKISKP